MNDVYLRKKGGEKLKEEKLEHLKRVFKESISKSMSNLKYLNIVDGDFDIENYSKKIADGLVYEVKIRINNK